jgi:hypothetical protein
MNEAQKKLMALFEAAANPTEESASVAGLYLLGQTLERLNNIMARRIHDYFARAHNQLRVLDALQQSGRMMEAVKEFKDAATTLTGLLVDTPDEAVLGGTLEDAKAEVFRTVTPHMEGLTVLLDDLHVNVRLCTTVDAAEVLLGEAEQKIRDMFPGLTINEFQESIARMPAGGCKILRLLANRLAGRRIELLSLDALRCRNSNEDLV